MTNIIRRKAKALRQMLSLRNNNGYELDAEEADKIVETVEGKSDE